MIAEAGSPARLARVDSANQLAEAIVAFPPPAIDESLVSGSLIPIDLARIFPMFFNETELGDWDYQLKDISIPRSEWENEILLEIRAPGAVGSVLYMRLN